mgnify:CR=1 FL=1
MVIEILVLGQQQLGDNFMKFNIYIFKKIIYFIRISNKYLCIYNFIITYL